MYVQRENVDQSALVMMNDCPTNLLRLARVARKHGSVDAAYSIIERCSNTAMRTEDAFRKLRELFLVSQATVLSQTSLIFTVHVVRIIA